MSAIRYQIEEEARSITVAYPDDEEVKLQVEALLNSLGDTLSHKEVLEELKAIRQSGMTFSEVFATRRP